MITANFSNVKISMIPTVVDICGICREDLCTDLKTLDCKHVFHTPCIDSWTERCNQCPFCRRCITVKIIVPLRVNTTPVDFSPHYALFEQRDWSAESLRYQWLSEDDMALYFMYAQFSPEDRVITNFCCHQQVSENFARRNMDYFSGGDGNIELLISHQTFSPEFRLEIMTYI